MKTFLLILSGVCVSLGLTSCAEHDAHHTKHLSLEVTQPLRKDTWIPREYVAQVHSVQHIEVRALEKGYITDVRIDEGQAVDAGAPLFQIMPRTYQAEYDKAKAELEFAEIEYNNTLKLKNDNIIAPAELNLAKAKLDKAQAELDLAKVHLDFTELSAPFGGITGRLHVRKGSLVEEGELLTTLSDNSEMWVYFNVPESEYLEFKRSENQDHKRDVHLAMADKTIYEHMGKITAIEADFNNETGNIAFRATFPNPDGLLRHGQTGNVVLNIPLEKALLIPQKATFEILDKRYVFVVDEKNEVHSKPVEVVAEMPDLFAIGGSLAEKDTILLDGLRKVRDGDEIIPKPRKPKAVLASLRVYAE